MKISNRLEGLILLFGDIFFLTLSLWVTLFVRHFEIPSVLSVYNHLVPFSLLFIVWIIIFFSAGLYEKHTNFFKDKLPDLILRVQLVNVLIAGVFFFFVPYFEIAPKTVLVLYLFVSVLFVTGWRLYLFDFLNKGKRLRAIVIGSEREVNELINEVNNNKRYHLNFSASLSDPTSPHEIESFIEKYPDALVVMDNSKKYGEIPASLVQKLEEEERLFHFHEVYERVFDRTPFSVIGESWFMEKVSPTSTRTYDVPKRVIDLFGASVLAIIVLFISPWVYLGMKLEGKGPLFFVQKRIGRGGTTINAVKFRTMEKMEDGMWIGESENKVTKVGAFLRMASIDEMPQCVNILKGEMSLIGPRNDIEGLGKRLEEAIPGYTMRYAVKPGITGWAQTKQQYRPGNISPQSIEETKTRLAYDLYYIKDRSLLLDMQIAFQTITTMLSRFGI
ncbi:MAG: sugar transferase [Candidatus Paceibacterota bacterium]